MDDHANQPHVLIGGVRLYAGEILERAIVSGITDLGEVMDQMVVERGGRLPLGRRVRRWLRHTFPRASVVPARPERPPPIPIGEPERIAGSTGMQRAVWAGQGMVGYGIDEVARPAAIVVTVWDEPAAAPRRVTELAGFTVSTPSASPAGDRVALHVMHDDRGGGGWSNDSAAWIDIELATGNTRTIVESTPDFRPFSSDAVWSHDGTRLAIAGVDRRAGPPPLVAVRILDATSWCTVASLERREMLHPFRFDGDALILSIEDRLVRWELAVAETVEVGVKPPERAYALPSGAPADVLDEAADSRVLVRQADGLAWSRPLRPDDSVGP